MSALTLARPEILALRAYQSARSLVDGDEARSFLDANESPSHYAGQLGFNRYPEPQPKALLRRFSELYGVSEQSLVIGRGSDEAIDLLVRTFCRPGRDAILICPPTYGVYEIAAEIQGAAVVRAPLRLTGNDPELDEAAILGALESSEPRVKTVFLCSPNNPTGTAFARSKLARICEAASGRALVVVDEAYAEFSEEESAIRDLERYPNLVVLRTLSKAWAMAGVRCGVAVAAPEVIALLQKVRAPYPMSLPAIQTALDGTDLRAQEALVARVCELRHARDGLVQALRELSQVLEIFESKANFILVRFKNSAQVMQATRERGIILRDRSKEAGLEGCIRITIGSREENEELLGILREVAQ